MNAQTHRIDTLMEAARRIAGGPGHDAVPMSLPPVLQRLVSSREVHLGLILLAEWCAIVAMIHAATAWTWWSACEAASLLMLGFWLPLRLLIIQPARRSAESAQTRLQAHEATAAEREMMMGILEESEGRLRAIFNNSPNGIVVLDVETTNAIDYNDTLPRLLGYSRNEFAALPMSRYVVDDAAGTARAHIERAIRGSCEQFTCVCQTRTGGTFEASFTAQVVTVNGQPAVSCIIRDISPQREGERALHVTHAKMQTMISELERRNLERTILTEMGSVLQACVSLDEAFSAVSRFGQRLFPSAGGALYVYSHSRSDLELSACWGHPSGGFDDVIVPNDCWGLRQGHTYERPDGSQLACHHVNDHEPASYLCVPLTAQGETLGMLHLLASAASAGTGPHPILDVNRPLLSTVCDQITLGIANLRLRETLRHQSIHDPLTGLYNRRFMEETLSREIPRAIRSGRPVAVIMADLDHFKTFNDTFGHEAGDVILAELGLLLKRSVRAGDIACRYGGEEFALVLPDATLEGTIKRVEAIRARVAELRVEQRGRNLGGLTMSLGIALLPEHGSTPEDLLRAADKALYLAKQCGRDQAQVAIPDAPTVPA